jgi:flagellar motility protein MotE (MotC chaperone)
MFRLLPYVIISLFMLLFSKLLETFENLPALLRIPEIIAAEKAPEAMPEEPLADFAEKISHKASTISTDALKTEEQEKRGEFDPIEKKKREPGELPRPKEEMISLMNADGKRCDYSAAELNLLQSLQHRREEIDDNAKELIIKQEALNVIMDNLDKKIVELQQVQREVKKLLSQYEQKEDEKIRGLVKIYESMKPKDAARIFNELQMDIILDVAEKMKEAKLGAILSSMSSTKAKEVTVQLANRRKLNLQHLLDK